jgi:regulator-associated protein of mTOR
LIPFFAEVAVEPPVFGGNESYFLNPSATQSSSSSSNPQGGSSGGSGGGNFGYQPPDLSQGNAGFNPGNGIPIENSSIVLASCRRDEILPMNPQYPADLFSACLTTPIAMAIRWLIVQVIISE